MILFALFTLLPFSVGRVPARTTSSDPLANYRAFVKAHPSIEVSVESEVNGRPGPKGVLLMQRGKRSLYRGEWGALKSVVTSTEAGYLDLEATNKLYDEGIPIRNGRIVRSRISTIPETGVPPVPFVDDLKAMLPENAKFKVTSAGGEEILLAELKSSMGSFTLEIKLDAEGKPTYLRSLISSMEGEERRIYRLSNYRYPKLSEKNFPLTVPLGYVPHSLPDDGYPLQPGMAAPLSGWKSADGQTTDFSGKGRILLAVLEADSGPSEAAMKLVEKLKGKVTTFVVGNLPGAYRDPDGSRMAKLNVSFSPTFFLVDADGKVEQIFMGFDREAPEELEKDVLSVLNPEPKAKKTASKPIGLKPSKG